MLKRNIIEEIKGLISEVRLEEFLANKQLQNKLIVIARITGDYSILERYRNVSKEITSNYSGGGDL